MVWRQLSIVSLSGILSACAPRYTPPSNLPSSVEQISTPRETKQWLETVLTYQYDKDLYGVSDFWASCSLTYQNKAGDCDDYAICAAALLQGDIEEGYIISFSENIADTAHAVFAYKKEDRWGGHQQSEQRIQGTAFSFSICCSSGRQQHENGN